MGVDFLRTLYVSAMRMYRDDREVLVEGRWYWCQPGAKVLPIPHTFGSFQLRDGDPPGEYLGEVRYKPTITRKPATIERLPGTGYCGSKDKWLHGCFIADEGTAPVDEDGILLCCPVNEPAAPGMQADGGSAEQYETWFVMQADDGSAIQSTQNLFAFGGQADDGQALFDGPTFGGQADDGSAIQTVENLFAFGGQADDGQAEQLIVDQIGEDGQSDDGDTSIDGPTFGGQADAGEAIQTVVSPSYPCEYLEVTDEQVFEFTIAGLTNSGCDECENLNSTHSLFHNASCTWLGVYDSVCSSSPGEWITQLSITGADDITVELYLAAPGGGIIYRATGTFWDGTTPVVLDFVNDFGGVCGDWPATVTVTPV